ncbi:hypothetical protein [Asanoa iriomotensis]|nr:hypothetical protein [Asanoa iriomotensis]
MRKVYKVLAYVVAAEVVVQAMLMVWAIAGLTKWVNNGGVFDKAVMEDRQIIFPEILGIPLHGLNGGLIIPGIALITLVLSFFAKIPGGVKWAGIVVMLAVVQGQLGYLGHDLPAAGALHGLNAIVLFLAALHAGRRVRAVAGVDRRAEGEAVRSAA